jgi:hypothetical protein
MNTYEAMKTGKFRHKDLLHEGEQERLARKAQPKEEKQILREVKTLLAFFF